MEKFIKNGRIYWINPMPIPGMESKQRIGIALESYNKNKTIFLHIGTSKFLEKSSLKATKLVQEEIGGMNIINDKNDRESHIHIDASKPECNTSLIKPHIFKDKYIDVSYPLLKKLKHIYHIRSKELEIIRIKKAQKFIIDKKYKQACKQIVMLKDRHPIKHKKLKPKEFIKNFITILKYHN